jgi:molybdate transport system substrate-binding protein
MIKRCFFLLCFLIFFLSAEPAQAQKNIRAGVAANYIQAFRDIAAAYEAKTGVHVEPTFTSSGNLYSQIINGAPYDIFLSADTGRPDRLYREGRSGKPFIYAKGKVILWSAKRDFCSAGDWRKALKKNRIRKISICNPETAPYGAAAWSVLQETGLLADLQGKLVTAQDVAQSFQYASTEAVDAGFCALSSALTAEGRKGCWYRIDEAPPIVQAAVVLKDRDTQEVVRFSQFLISPDAEAIRKKYGYE